MKTEVYSWRLSAQRKSELESEARRKGTTVAALLEQITGDWLEERRNARSGEAEEQAAIRRRAASAIGSISSGDPLLGSQVSQRMQESLKKRYGR
jgi:hypothetical protein